MNALNRVLIGFLLVCWSAGETGAATLTVNIDSEITGLNLTGTDFVPLASDPGDSLADSVDGYGFVNSDITVSESPTMTSTATGTVVVDSTSMDVTIDTSFDFYLDLQFADIDPETGRDYAAGLGNPVSLPAPGPLTATLSSVVSFTDVLDFLMAGALDGLGATTSSTTVVYPLGVDVNANGLTDVMKLEAMDLDFDIEDIEIGDIEIDEADLLAFLAGGDVVTDISLDLSITSASLTFNGEVLDEVADPPFSFTVSSATSSGPAPHASVVPEPTTIGLFALGLLGLAARIRRRR